MEAHSTTFKLEKFKEEEKNLVQNDFQLEEKNFYFKIFCYENHFL